MTKWTSFFALCLLVGCGCDGTPDKSTTVVKTDRYADFNDSVSVEWRSVQGNAPQRSSVLFTLIPTKPGCFLVEAGNSDPQKVIVGESEFLSQQPSPLATTQPSPPKPFKFGGVSEVLVTYSDGKDIQRTVVKVDP
jgi:hypothetical protein